MVNRMYRRGRAKEYRAMELLRKDGWMVGRSAGSHSPVDLFAAREGRRLLVQVKSRSARIRESELIELVRWAEAFDADAEVWSFRNGRALEKKNVHTSTRAE